MTGKRKLTWKLSWQESLTGIHRDVLDSDTLDSYVEEECSADKNLYGAYLEYKEARDTLNQVLRGRCFQARDCDSCTRWPLSEAGCAER